jgi:hypothetical protein
MIKTIKQLCNQHSILNNLVTMNSAPRAQFIGSWDYKEGWDGY